MRFGRLEFEPVFEPVFEPDFLVFRGGRRSGRESRAITSDNS